MSDELDLTDPSLKLEGRVWGYAPIQAEGRVAGRGFYFRERHDHWDFSIWAREPESPAFPKKSDSGLRKGGSCAPSFSHFDAAKLIRQFAQEFLALDDEYL